MDLIAKHNLTDLFNKNSPCIKLAILNKIKSVPTPADKRGFVYGFYGPNDTNTKTDFCVKLGRTEKSTPVIRIAQWNGEEVFSKKTIFNRKLERLIHLFFYFAREERIVNGAKEIEWFHFKKSNNIKENDIVRYVACIDDVLNDTDSEKVLDNNTKIFPNVLPKTQEVQKTSNMSEELNGIIAQYNSSTYFHVPKRRVLFDSLKTCFANDKKGKIIPLEKQGQLLTYCNTYNNSSYFHVGPRRELFSAIKLYFQ